jgi:hypothetical protein
MTCKDQRENVQIIDQSSLPGEWYKVNGSLLLIF